MKRRQVLGLAGLAVAGGTLRAYAAEEPRWQRDGAASLARIGVLTPEFDPVPESELSTIAPPGVSIHAARVTRNRTPADFARPPHVDAAVAQLAGLRPRAIAFAYTSSSYALGAETDEKVRARLEARALGIPVVLTCPAATQALRTLGAERVALVHPPWFKQDIVDKGMEYFRGRGFNVVRCTRIEPARAFTEVEPQEVYEWARRHTPDEAQALFIAGNGLRAIGAIEALESTLGRPVITANQVVLWAALRAAGVAASIAGYGRIFKGSPKGADF